MNDFTPKRFVKEHVYQLVASREKVFPLLCPVREYEWIHGWVCDMVYSDSGIAENNCIFKTEFPHGLGEGIWVVSKYDTENFGIGFVIVYPGMAVENLDVWLEAADNGSIIHWRRTYTGLSPDGNRVLEHLTGEFLDMMMQWTINSLNHYLAKGEMLTEMVPGS
ncbi:MAG: hypothetical protein HY801_15290 [Candidatus Lindowbacteria bacterium]|nr:hypothetical protein [Candidatus Lindowbacteria bacterium]